MRTAVNRGLPPIVLVYTHELPYWTVATAHAVVVIGFEEDAVIVNDPAMEQAAIHVPLSDFLLAWDAMANLYAVLARM